MSLGRGIALAFLLATACGEVTQPGVAADAAPVGTVIDAAPVPDGERCDNGLDDDGDREIDEGCACTAGQRQSCYPGPADEIGRGLCARGSQACDDGPDGPAWGECADAVTPSDERCDEVDNDCDGSVDDVAAPLCFTRLEEPGTVEIAARCTRMLAVMWAGGGGGGGAASGPNDAGGAGGFASGTFSASVGEPLVVVLGGAGQDGLDGPGAGGDPGGGGGGGNSGNSQSGGGGGGLSGLFRTSVGQGGAVLIAGGGGGGGGGGASGQGGAGGGLEGEAGSDGAAGGTQREGAAPLAGGDGGPQASGDGGGGGGGGWFGGAGGEGANTDGHPGGGGAGYAAPDVVGAALQAGSGRTPGGADRDERAAAGDPGRPGAVLVACVPDSP